MSDRPWPHIVCERRYPGDPRIIGASTVHMEAERTRYIPVAELERIEAERDEAETDCREAIADAQEMRAQYEGLKERLLSDEVLASVAREHFDYLQGYGGQRWEEAHPNIRQEAEANARALLRTALLAAQKEKT